MSVRISCTLRRVSVRRAALERMAGRVLRYAGAAQSDLSLSVIGDRRMQQLNARYRRRARPTDVLAFAAREAPQPTTPFLGDVVISLDTARRQAREAGHSVDREIAILLIHGVLHLMGYDHERSAQDARRMQKKEREILQALGPLPRLVTGDK